MTRKNRHFVLIAGAGPAGLAAALFLHQRGIDVEVVDERWQPPDDDFTVVLTADTLARLDDVGARLDLAGKARAIDAISIYDRNRIHATVPLGEAAGGIGPAAVMPLRVVSDTLEEALRARHVKVQWHRRLARIDATLDRVVAEVDVLDRDSAGYAIAQMEGSVVRTQTHQPTYLIAADGPESVARTQLRIGWQTLARPMIIAGFEFASTWDAGREAHLIVGDETAVLWPAPDGRLRLTFQLHAATPGIAERFESRPGPDRSDLLTLVRAHLPWMDLQIGDLLWSHVERFEPGVAERVRLGPTWLLGEAAHHLLPLASHSLNHGIQMAHDLAVIVDEVERAQGGGERLEQHAERSHALAVGLAQPEERYLPEAGVDPFIATNFGRILAMIPARGRDLDSVAGQLGIRPKGR